MTTNNERLTNWLKHAAQYEDNRGAILVVGAAICEVLLKISADLERLIEGLPQEGR